MTRHCSLVSSIQEGDNSVATGTYKCARNCSHKYKQHVIIYAVCIFSPSLLVHKRKLHLFPRLTYCTIIVIPTHPSSCYDYNYEYTSLFLCNPYNILFLVYTVIILIIARAFIRETSFLKVGDGRLLEVQSFYIVLRIGVGDYQGQIAFC